MTSERAYHHGNLREAALLAARQIVLDKGHVAMAMHQVAAALGVAPSALYRHYRGRSELLAALANTIHAELAADLETLMAAEVEPWLALEEAGRRFLAFAQREPALFHMLYDNEVINAPDAEARLPALEHSYRLLLKLVRRARPDATLREARLQLLGLWSTLFGYASVRSQGALKSYMSTGLTAEVIEQRVLQVALGADLPPR